MNNIFQIFPLWRYVSSEQYALWKDLAIQNFLIKIIINEFCYGPKIYKLEEKAVTI